ncbi:MAG: LuxR C-terminal-related transcriptional regulator, partial [Actinobacteria bacterium]|nr:LuxR C-terminal-related transcriptional regulator [Actinomycetota bacterium]
VAVPRRSLVPLPAALDAERAVLAEPLACCVGALAPHAVAAGTRVLVLGCGPIGLLTVFLAARAGAEVRALDPVAERRAQAERLGAAGALARAAGAAPGTGTLTRREREVLELIAEGLHNRAIAQRLVLSEHTVHRHVANLLNKLGVSTRAAAVARAPRRPRD